VGSVQRFPLKFLQERVCVIPWPIMPQIRIVPSMISVYMVDLLSRLEVIKEAQSDDAGLFRARRGSTARCDSARPARPRSPFPFTPMLTHTKSPPGGLLVQVPNRPGYRVASSRLIYPVENLDNRTLELPLQDSIQLQYRIHPSSEVQYIKERRRCLSRSVLRSSRCLPRTNG